MAERFGGEIRDAPPLAMHARACYARTMNPPKVFISATSGDLRSIRQIVKEALLTINCHPVEQTNFEPDWRSVEGMLRAKIEGCQALIHIAGMRYGAEPDPATLPPGVPRRSYTQMEYHLGCQLHAQRGDEGFRVYTFVCPEGFPYDAEPDAEAEEKRALQRVHRTVLMDSPRLYEKPASPDEIHERVLALQEQVLSFQKQQAEVKHEVRRTHRTLLIVLALVLVLGASIYGVYRVTQRGFTGIIESQKIDAAKIKEHLRQSSERRLAEDMRAADLEKKSDDRQRLREAAQAAHQSRLARIDDLASSFALREGRADATAELKEMTRILQEEGVDKALAYIEGQRAAMLARVAAADAWHLEQKRAQLQPLLQAAGLQWTKGQTGAARASYQELLKLDPQWPQALEGYAWFLFDQTIVFKTTGPFTKAVDDAGQCLAHAQRLHELDDTQPRAQRVLKNAHDQMGDVLVQRGAEGDASQIMRHRQQSLALAEALYTADPNYPEAVRDVSISLSRLGDFLAQRDQPGDAEAALKHYTRSLELTEKLPAADPDSAEAARDVSVSLNKLGDFLAKRGQPGDAEAALKHYTRSLEQREKLLAANPDSAQAARDVSLSDDRLGDFLARRGQPGDAEAALKHYTRCQETLEKLLQANPDSAQAARDVAASLQRLAVYADQRGDKAGEERHSRACYDLLHPRIIKGVTFDPPVVRLHEQLHARFGGK